ncbi:carbon-monoxide dehydrogenase large subunit [Streptomyces daqingensis]|uniref:Carbon-monoxide dehydrogenase large subunit n=1 Tax=Streptomyces daqingensis TaxID=1472640 RepID=A0ABQ2MSR3_9ACTN|nr:xanthine dehydrogenase family protein molybdopterin-binding subunit [Streptomyces daqingensis]GGO57122.1 carbon-monoxide dehydrogenase large subunit [Streptomyces daqingensis]
MSSPHSPGTHAEPGTHPGPAGTRSAGVPAEPAPAAVGRAVDRVDAPAKVTGRARYAAEFPYEDLAWAAFTYATVTRGRITAIDTAAASALPGVIAVITHLDAPRMKPSPKPNPIRSMESMATATSVDYLNTPEVHWNGQPVAVVVAEDPETAAHAAESVAVTYEVLPHSADFAAEERHAVPQRNSVIQHASGTKGDADAALAAAPVSVDLRFTTPRHHHNALEPHATTAVWDGGRLTVHDGTQNIHWLRSQLATKFDVPVGDVRVLAPFVGGGFGGKSMVWPGTILTALAARVTGRPVRAALTREGVYRSVGGRQPSVQRVAIGAERDGGLTALIHTSTAPMGKVGGAPEQITSVARHMYGAEHIRHRQYTLGLDTLSTTNMRAPGESIGSFAMEAAVDELAYELGLDPVELRLRNEPSSNPIDGKPFAHRQLTECFANGASLFGWPARSFEPRSMREGSSLVGWGTAAAYHPAWQLPANVTVRLDARGRALVRCAFHEMGMGTATAQSQIAADALGVPFEAVTVEYGDSGLPTGPGAGGSAQTASVASSLLEACEKLKKSIGTPREGESYAQLLARTGRDHAEAVVGSETRVGKRVGQVRFTAKYLREQRRWMKAACGAHFCEVRVDADTGEARVTRWVAVFDVGRVVNAKTAASQLRGGIVMGIGQALTEQTLLDPRTGRIMNPSLSEYHVPVHADVPRIDVSWLDDPDPTMPLGIVGVGEVGITGVAGAVANALHHATGRRLRDLPLTLEKLL